MQSKINFKSRSELTALEALTTPVWIFDIDRHAMWWANQAGLKFWHANSLEELIDRDFGDDSTAARERLDSIRKKQTDGHASRESWTFYPIDEPVTTMADHSFITLETGRQAVLIHITEQFESGINSQAIRLVEAARNTSAMVSMFNLSGKLLVENPASVAFRSNSGKSAEDEYSLAEHLKDSQKAKEIIEYTKADRVFRLQREIDRGTGPAILNISARRGRDPETGEVVIFLTEEDVTERVKLSNRLEKINEELELRVADRTKELNLQRQYYKSLFEYAPDAIIIVDLDEDMIVAANPSAAELWGTTVDELVSGNFDYFQGREKQPEDYRYLSDAKAIREKAYHEGMQTLEWPVKSRTGKQLITSVRVTKVPDPQRRLVRVSAFDITATKRQQERYRTLFEQSPDAILIWDIDKDEAIAANPGAAELWETSIEKITSNDFIKNNALVETQPDGQLSAEQGRAIRQAAFEGKTQIVDWVTATSAGVEKQTIVRCTRFPDTERRLVMLSIVDVTERKQEQERYRSLFEHSPDAILIWDVDNNSAIAANPSAASLWETTVDDILSGKFSHLKTGVEHQPDGSDSLEKFRSIIIAALQGETQATDWVIKTTSGKEKHTIARVNQFPDPRRRLIRISLADISVQKREQERYRILFENAPDAIIIWDYDQGLPIAANPSAASLWETSVDDLVSGQYTKSLDEIEMQPDGQRSDEKALAIMQAALDGQPQTVEWHGRTATGKEIETIVGMTRFPDPERRLIRISAINVTDQKQEQERYRALFEHAKEAILIWDIDIDAPIAINPSAAELWESDTDTILAGKLHEQFPELEFQPDGQRTYEKGATARHAAYETDQIMNWSTRTASGKVKQTIVSMTRFPDPDRRLIRISMVDITEQASMEERYRLLFDFATDAIVILDWESQQVIEANPRAATLFGIPPEDFFNGKYQLLDLTPEFQPDGRSSAKLANQYHLQALAGDFPRFEWVTLNADGDKVHCEVRLARFPDPTRQLIRSSITDISARRKAEQQSADLQKRLNQSQRLEAVGQMTGGVAHDFNNLLSIVLGNMELLLGDLSDAKHRSYVEATIRATERGANLARNMLAFARRSDLKPSAIDLSKSIESLQGWMSRTIPANIKVETAFQDNLWLVEADLAGAESALLNLMINARDAMPEGGILTIETSNITVDHTAASASPDLESGRFVMLAVSDTGIGISPENLEKVFDPFFSTKQATNNSGLGLSMVHGFMSQSGGAVRIYSQLGIGTTIKLFFPMMLSQLEEASPTVIDEAPQSFQPQRILIAEDQTAVLEILIQILSTEGHHVVAASTGDQAAEKFDSEGPFDLLVTDVVMPGKLQGPDLARLLRSKNRSLPIIFMSGYAREATMHGNGLRESDIRLMKPVSRQQLLSAVQTAVNSQD